MVTVPSRFPAAHLLSRLSLARPRFVYLWVRTPQLPLPIFLFAPLVMLEFFLTMGVWFIRRSGSRDPQMDFALHALQAMRGQTWEVRKMPPFALVEVELRPKTSSTQSLPQVCLKIGLW